MTFAILRTSTLTGVNDHHFPVRANINKTNQQQPSHQLNNYSHQTPSAEWPHPSKPSSKLI